MSRPITFAGATVHQLLSLKKRRWDAVSLYDSIILIPTGHRHDSGYAIMAICGCQGPLAVELAGEGCCDDIMACPQGAESFRIDCLWPSLLIRLHGDYVDFRVGNALSTTVVSVVGKGEK
jgi:hypothetical protein